MSSAPHVIGQAPSFLQVLRHLERVAPTDRPVLILGPTGSGKELIAQLIHHQAKGGNSGPLIEVNCGAISEHLAEAEFFGYAKGAVTGAVGEQAGYFERASGGTLFLDEIGELPKTLQPKLLRVLETGTFRPLGSAEVRRFQGRLVAATHRNLPQMAHQGKFREDLYYRLAVFVLNLPGLDQRREDIPALVAYFASLQPRTLTFSAEAMDYLQAQEWPGHVRQLRSLVERLSVLSDDDHITVDILQPFLAPVSGKGISDDALAEALMALEGPDKLAAVEQLLVNRAMRLAGNNKTAAARVLGVSRKTIERRLQSLDDRRMTAAQSLEAARLLVDRSDFREAILLLKQGLDQVDMSSTQPDVKRTIFDLYRLLGVCLRSVDGWLSDSAKQAYEAAFKAGKGMVEDVELNSLLFGIWSTQLMTMELGKARATAQEMLQHAQASGNEDLIVEAHVAMTNTLFWVGDSIETLACLTRGGLMPVQRADCTGTQGFDLIGLAMTFEGLASFQVGHFKHAQLVGARLAKRSYETDEDHPFNRAIALQGAAWLACLFEDMEQLGQLAADLESLSIAHGFVFYRGIGQIFRGCHLASQGRFEEAAEAIREGYDTHVLRNGGKLFYSFQAWKYGELLLEAGRAPEAERMLARALEVSIQHQDRAYLSELLYVQARAKMAMNDLAGAEEGLRGALSTALILGAVPARLGAATHLAHLLDQTGRRSQAIDVLAKAVRVEEKDAAFPGLIRAIDLLGKLRR